jgi:hypothetical protein
MTVITALVIVAGFLGIYTLFFDVNIFLKILAIGGFILCFFSSAPFVSFTSYMLLIACCYAYIFLARIKNWDRIFDLAFTFFLLNILMMAIQFIRKDSLLNFAKPDIGYYGLIGSKMQLESFLICLSALLIARKGFNKKILMWLGISGILYTCIYGGLIIHICGSFLVRLPVWKHTLILSLKHPIVGWGMGTFKHLFMPLSGMQTQPWEAVHNDWLQVFFETGLIGLAFITSLFGFLFYKLLKLRKLPILIGLIMISIDMMVHYPLRQFSTILVIVLFAAYATKEILWQPKI